MLSKVTSSEGIPVAPSQCNAPPRRAAPSQLARSVRQLACLCLDSPANPTPSPPTHLPPLSPSIRFLSSLSGLIFFFFLAFFFFILYHLFFFLPPCLFSSFHRMPSFLSYLPLISVLYMCFPIFRFLWSLAYP